MKKYAPFFLFLCLSFSSFAQEIELFEQFNGRYDYTAIGNTMNLAENNTAGSCTILTSSSANLSLGAGQTVKAAYLYWAGSGPGDFSISLNNIPINPNRTFSFILDSEREYFAAVADVTSHIIAGGNISYTVSDLNLTSIVTPPSFYCSNSTNFAGWAIVVVYEDPSLPLNQLSIYDGLQGVSREDNLLTINLDNLNVIDNEGAKIGFVAWEGDSALSVNESLRVNGNLVSNPPLNPSDNAFNGTNSFTGSDSLYNMDLDFYDVENNINIGDTSAEIKLTSGDGIVNSDFIMINNIVTVFNSELPDGTATIDQVATNCNSRTISVDYTIANFNCTALLPANTPIAFYADGIFVGSAATQNNIPIGGTETGSIVLTIPVGIPNDFILTIVVDNTGNGTGIVTEINENNNSGTFEMHLLSPEIAGTLQDLILCDELPNDDTATFDLTVNTPIAIGNQADVSVTYHLTQNDADLGISSIATPSAYQNTGNPQEIFVRLEENSDPTCFVTDSFFLTVVATPEAFDPGPFFICDDPTNDGVAVFDLTPLIPDILGTQNNVNLNFYETANDAISETNPIPNPGAYQNITNPQTIYVRVESNALSICFSTVAFDLIVGEIGPIVPLENLLQCDIGFDSAFFDLTQVENGLESTQDITGYYRSESDAGSQTNPIITPTNYQNASDPQIIYVRFDDPNEACYRIGAFEVSIEECPPFVPEGFSPNGDGINDTFEITGLYDIFPDFKITIFSRYGNIVYEGNNSIPEWNGTSNHGVFGGGGKVPTATYYYVLNLNHPEYKIIKGWVYLIR